MPIQFYNLGIPNRKIKESIYLIRKFNYELADIFIIITKLFGEIKTIIVSEMNSIELDLTYWQQLSESSYININISKFNIIIYRSIMRLLSINDYIDYDWTIDDNIELILSTIRVIYRKLSVFLSSIHDITSNLQIIYQQLYSSIQLDYNVSSDVHTTIYDMLKKILIEIIRELKGLLDSNSVNNDILIDELESNSIAATYSSNYSIIELQNLIMNAYEVLNILKSNSNSKEYPLNKVNLLMRRPSSWERHWFRNVILFIGTTMITRNLYISYNNGNLMNTYNVITDTVNIFIQDHIIEPMKSFIKELFETIQNREEIVSKHDLDQSREALHRMLTNFSQSTKGVRLINKLEDTFNDLKYHTIKQIEISTHEEAMEALMKSYESALPNPIFNILCGNLMTAMLIQMQKLKVHTEAAMLKMDKVLASNQLTMAGTAAMPAFAVIGGLYYLVHRTISSMLFSGYHSNISLRLALTEVERSLLDVYSSDNTIQSTDASITYRNGLLHYNLNKLRRELYIYFGIPISRYSTIYNHVYRKKFIESYNSLVNINKTTNIITNQSPNSIYFHVTKLYNYLSTHIHDLYDNLLVIYYNREYNSSSYSLSSSKAECNGIFRDMDDLESSDAHINGNRKIITVIRMRTSYKCFSPK